MLHHFYWLIDHQIAGCSCPGRAPAGSGDGRPPAGSAAIAGSPLDRDLAWLCAQGIGALLSLTETALSAEAVRRHGLTSLHLPVPDMTAPRPDEFQRALDFIDYQRSLGRSVAVHCLVGQGRTATILAAYLIREGMEPGAAIDALRQRCPGAIGSPQQERALHSFAGRRAWVI